MAKGSCDALPAILRAEYGPAEIDPVLARQADRRCTTSRRLPEMLTLRKQGLSYAKIGKRLGLSKRQVEHVLVRHRRHE